MKKKIAITLGLLLTIVLVVFCFSYLEINSQYKSELTKNLKLKNDQFISHVIDLKYQTLAFYWKGLDGQRFKNFENLKNHLLISNKKLTFAVNGGMFDPAHEPVGLYIENGTLLTPLNTQEGEGNFFMKPNGIFYLTDDGQAYVSTTEMFEFLDLKNVTYATQSGPMLLIDGDIHPNFNPDSKSFYIRNGVGILPDGTILFAMSNSAVNFYDFANYFRKQGVKNALFLDGAISKTYLPEASLNETDGEFSVMIGGYSE